MATAANLRAALTFPARIGNLFFPAGKTVTAAALTRLQDALAREYAGSLGGRAPDVDDAAAWLYKQAAAFVTASERRLAQAAVAEPAVFE